MAKRRKWKAPNDPTAQAKLIWATIYPKEVWPRGWRVSWAGFMRNCYGLCIYGEKRILLNWADARKKGMVETLVHEFIHMRIGRDLRHGAEFDRLTLAASRRLFGPDYVLPKHQES